MSKKHTNTCFDCIHLATCYKIEHFGRDLETNTPCREFIGVSDRVEVVRCKDCKYVDNGYIGHLNCRFSILCPYLVWITANGANKKCLLLKKKWL